ncbi:MAG: hypothetical protein HFH39_09695 [Lachnospiraceae bacterium]|nr:hypothetical protein [Lachnospiraceae bacterium]
MLKSKGLSFGKDRNMPLGINWERRKYAHGHQLGETEICLWASTGKDRNMTWATTVEYQEP